MTVTIGWCDPGTTRGEFTESLAHAAAYEAAHGRLVSVVRVQAGPLLCEGRNRVVEQFLRTDADWLFQVDSDMVFTYDSIERLVGSADVDARPVVGGLCYGVNHELGQFPTIYRRVQGLPVAQLDPPTSGMIEVDGTGAAFNVTHRRVFEQWEHGAHHRWYHRRTVPPTPDHPGGVLGEDLSWHWWLRDNGVPIFVNLDVEAGHVKPTVVNSDTYRRPV